MTAAERLDCVVVGAGVVGLAVARALALAGREVCVVEAADAIGTATSSRNSEVIHAGIYYPPGSLKARLCVTGRRQLYAYCAARGITHRRIGKLIVATGEADVARLEGYAQRAAANGVDDLEWHDAAAVAALEPDVRAVAALYSPSTGILSSHEYLLALRGDIEAHGGTLALRSRVARIVAGDDGFAVFIDGDADPAVHCRMLVNAAGLHAPALAGTIEGLDAAWVPRAYFARGHYYTLSGRSPFGRLVYPVAEQAGLGIHVTLDTAGVARFGPDVEWIERIDYRVDPRRADGFYAAIREYWPGLEDGRLQPAYAGIRPKIVGPDAPAADFLIQGPAEHGVPGLVNLFGIESPGITASLAIAEEVVARL